MTLSIPTIHLNGTSRDSLIESLYDAAYALTHAAQLLAFTCPNGRDYYPQGPNALRTAIDQHNARMAKLEDVRRELFPRRTENT